MGASNFFNAAATNRSLNVMQRKWKNCISLFTSISKDSLDKYDIYTSESKVHFSNEVYHHDDLLLESWWNIFDERYLRHGWGWTITLIAAYMSILVVGVIGNLMVIFVVLLRPQMRTVTNMFITNLAVADLLVVVCCVPSTLLANIFAPWILGSFMCKAVAYLQGVSICASAYSLAAISLDRCKAVNRNYERPRGFSQTTCVKTVFIIWTVALSFTLPWAVIFENKVSEYDGHRHCVEQWGAEKLGNIYFIVVNLVCFYAIPLLLIFVANWKIYCHVIHRDVPQNSASSAPIIKLHRHTRHVVLRMLGVVTLTFLFSWLPLYILVIIIKFSERISESKYNALEILIPIAQWFGSCNSSVNPLLYAFLNKKFRRMFKSILPAWIPVKPAEHNVGGSIRTPSFTTTPFITGSRSRSKVNSRSDYQRATQNGNRNTDNQLNIQIGRFSERTGTMAKTTIQIISSTIPCTAALISGNLKNISHAGIASTIAVETMTEL